MCVYGKRERPGELHWVVTGPSGSASGEGQHLVSIDERLSKDTDRCI